MTLSGPLFGPLFGVSGVAAACSDDAWVQAMLDVEAALTRALVPVGLADAADADAVSAACAQPVGAAALGAGSVADGNPVIPLVRLLRGRVPAASAAAVHRGATSQDVLDTAAMLVVRTAVALIGTDLQAAADACAGLAARHRTTPMAARTLLQQALPTTFGALAAGWGAGLDRAAAALRDLPLDVQLGGAAGTLASLYPHGPKVRAALATGLGLGDPGGCWHTERTRVGTIAAALGLVCSAVGKVATDVVLLAQTELGELHESTGGTSSTLPHKQNPVAAVTARAAAAQAPGLVATLLGAQPELQRGAGPWHAEWPALTGLLLAAGGATARLRESVTGLRVDTDAMARNLGSTDGLLMAERVTTALTPDLGRIEAQRVVTAAATAGVPFAQALDGTGLDVGGLLDPAGYLGHATDSVDAYLEHRSRS